MKGTKKELEMGRFAGKDRVLLKRVSVSES